MPHLDLIQNNLTKPRSRRFNRLAIQWSLLHLTDGYTGGIIAIVSALLYNFEIFHNAGFL